MEFVKFEVKEKIAVITIHRPEKLNALNRILVGEITKLVAECQNNPTISGVIVTGSGEKAFVAGADISEFLSLDRVSAENLSRQNQNHLFDKISNSEKPFIACINGFALGGGLELALSCPIRYASENAQMGLPELGLGIIPGYGGTQRLVEIIGKSRALEMMLTSEFISAQKALEWGLINAIVPLKDLVEHAIQKLKIMQSKAPMAISACLRAVSAQADKNKNGYETEIFEFGKLFETDDFKEGISAFMQKRKPNFLGK
jgi:enoyl-CoA hydratase